MGTNNITILLQLFAALGNPDEREVEDAYYKLKDFLSKPGNSQYIIANEVVPFLHVGLQHPDPLIRTLTIDQLSICVGSIPNSVSFLKQNNLVPSVAAALGDDFSVAKKAETFFIELAKQKEGANLIFEETTKSTLDTLMRDEMHQLRVMDLFAEISRLSPELFALSQPFLTPIVHVFHTTDDVLRKLNFVEIITKISSTNWGVEFVRKAGLLENFMQILTDYLNLKKSDAQISRSDSFLTNKIITFIGQAAKDDASISFLSQLPFLDIISAHLEELFTHSKNYFRENTEVSITAVGEIGRSQAGLNMIFAHPNLLRHYAAVMLTDDSAILTCAFHSFGELFSRESNSGEMEKIYNQLPAPFIPHVIKYASKPFEDLRYAAYHFLQGLAYHKWGVKIMMSHPGFFEWLTNRTTENTKPGKEWKFAIIQKIVTRHKDVVEEILGAEKAAELQLYINRGVFFLQPEVALEVATKV
eukprot:Phypoly_transcript_07859.p1 GENE.Phypoly_transcript_07859~~Phypoly_transcript_07859.p1  ORF type:complete len:473 (+),score=81.58 Phypoly_transcript_07859:157-1575(+)